MEPIDTFKNRLKKAMEIRDIKSVDLHEKTGISESLISKYLSGGATARQRKLSLLSDALNINPVWLMGYDIPMEKEVKLDKSGNPVISVPILGTVKAGYDYLAEENWLGTIDIKTEFIESGAEYFALKIKRR